VVAVLSSSEDLERICSRHYAALSIHSTVTDIDKTSLYEYLGQISGVILPVPFFPVADQFLVYGIYFHISPSSVR